MFFINENGYEIVNTTFVERFCIVEKSDAALIVASYGENRAVTVGRYKDKDEAGVALYDLCAAIDNDAPYKMLASSYAAATVRAGNGYHGKKIKNHGGS